MLSADGAKGWTGASSAIGVIGAMGVVLVLFPIGLISISGMSSEIAGTGAEGRLARAGIGAVGDGIAGAAVEGDGGILDGTGRSGG